MLPRNAAHRIISEYGDIARKYDLTRFRDMPVSDGLQESRRVYDEARRSAKEDTFPFPGTTEEAVAVTRAIFAAYSAMAEGRKIRGPPRFKEQLPAHYSTFDLDFWSSEVLLRP